MKAMRLLALGLMAMALHAGTVFMSAHGKTYHVREDCTMLRRSSVVYSADEGEATAHGLHKCAVCSKEKKAGAGASGAASWAKEAKRKEAK